MYGCESWTERKLSTEELMLLNSGVGEDSWESLGLQGDPWVHPKGNQSWIFIGKADAEAETLIIWPSDAKNQLIGKRPWCWEWLKAEEKGMTEDEAVGWHDRLNGHEFEQSLGDGEGQGSLGCCSPWGCKESDTIWWLNNNNKWLYKASTHPFLHKPL